MPHCSNRSVFICVSIVCMRAFDIFETFSMIVGIYDFIAPGIDTDVLTAAK